MEHCFSVASDATGTPLVALHPEALQSWLERQTQNTRDWVGHNEFKARPGQSLALPGDRGEIARVLVGMESEGPSWHLASAPGKLPAGVYTLESDWSQAQASKAAIGWGLAGYRFERYLKPKNHHVRLSLAGWPFQDVALITHTVEAVALVRDLINTPAEDMMPEHLAVVCEELAQHFGGDFTQIVGDKLLKENYPAIHRVGRASAHEPRCLDLRWGDPQHPLVTLVGKGVCFDSGGLDLKPSKGMRQMKKDMGGAAHVLGLARLIMAQHLPVRLRVLIGAVENAIGSQAFRPGDVIPTRGGLSVEVDNTDAEGRLVLCDLLTEACAEKPDLILDFATLTGAARIAVGTEIAAYFTDDDALADSLLAHSMANDDPVWRLPLHNPYRHMLDSDIADIANSSGSGYAGAITAGLFLKAFVPQEQLWAHFDVMAYNTRSRPGRPKGGEAMGIRAAYAMLEARYPR